MGTVFRGLFQAVKSGDRNSIPEDPGPGSTGDLDQWAQAKGFSKVAGVDEAGRGPLAGPVVAAAVILPPDHEIIGLADSKKLSARKREILARSISQRAEGWGIGVIGSKRIDEVNIRIASLEAMSLAFEQLLAQGLHPDLVITDGRDEFDLPPQTPRLVQRAFIKADDRSESVAAASILAKVYRDSLMMEYHALWPHYGFDRHKGYPTAEHRRLVAQHGPCEIHRQTFGRVAKS